MSTGFWRRPPEMRKSLPPLRTKAERAQAANKSAQTEERLGFSHFFAGVWLIGVLFTWAVYGWGWALLVFFLPGILFAMAMDTD